MNKVSKVVTIMGVAVMLLGFNATAGSLLGGDRYDKDGNCFKSGVLGNVPCKTAVPAPIPTLNLQASLVLQLGFCISFEQCRAWSKCFA
jgi:hypothetical protein